LYNITEKKKKTPKHPVEHTETEMVVDTEKRMAEKVESSSSEEEGDGESACSEDLDF
jgi:hypothetical protein